MESHISKVISPYTIDANRMAQAILRPSVVDFIEIATASENLELQIEETPNAADSSLADKTLVDSGVRQSMGIILGEHLSINQLENIASGAVQ